MAGIIRFWNSPNKPTNSSNNSINNNNNSREPVNGIGSDPRGIKRKAKPDPYEAMDEDDDDDDIIPARKTPASQRSARSRISSATTPGSSTRPRVSLPGKRRPGRPSLTSRNGDVLAVASQPNTEAVNAARTKAPDNARALLDARAPVAPMGGLELLGNNAIDTSTSSDFQAPQTKTATRPSPQDKDKGKAKENVDESERKPTQQVKEEERGEDDREEHEIAKLLEHRMAGDRSGAVELLVQWVGEGEQDATWEAENEIQQGAEEILYEYWKAQGGRINALFHKPKSPPPEIYHVFKVLRHEKKNRGGFQFEVQWVGHPATRGETSMETETKLRSVAPELLDEYWESVGGRESHLAKRGRAKKIRTE